MSTPYDEPVDGPPPTPFQRARRRRRRRFVAASGVVTALLVGAVVLYVAFQPEPAEEGLAAEEDAQDDTDEGIPDPPPEEAEEQDEAAEGSDPPDIELDLDDDGRPDTAVPDEEHLPRPDLGGLDEDERSLAELLLDIDASERAMLGFQLDVVAARDPDRSREEADEADDGIRVAALHALDALAALRGRMEEPQDDPMAEQVRDTYVIHLDSWVRWLEAIAEDPAALNDETGWFTIDINRTAAAFVRAVDEALSGSEDLDAEVVRFAEGILDRGFPPPEDAPV